MSDRFPSKAFILAAGLGSRLRPYTLDRPKPLVSVGGETLLDRTLDHLREAGVRETVLNLHYLPEKIPQHLQMRDDFKFHFSHEPELLDTGGGIKKALAHFEDSFFVLSGDGLWENAAGKNTLKSMAQMWDPERMDILILLQPVSSMTLTQGVGDYGMGADGRPVRSPDRSGEYMFTSMRINHKRIFEAAPDGAFSYLDLLDKAQKDGRLYGIMHEGDWHHISTPQDLEAVDTAYKDNNQKKSL